MKIENIKVYDLEESMFASGYPMQTDLENKEYEIENLKYWLKQDLYAINNILKNDNRFKLVNDNLIFIVDNKEVEISPEDLIKISKQKWSYNSSRGYIRDSLGTIELHRFIMDDPDDMDVDHKDRNKDNYKRDNLRICTHRENSINKDLLSNNSTGFMGVYYRKDRNTWQPKIEVNKKVIRLGTFKNKEDAIKARLNAEKDYFGEFAPQRHLFEQYGIKDLLDYNIVEKFKPSLTKALKHYKRYLNLGLTGGTEGHNQFLTGIRVAFDVTFSNKAWVEAERYRFLEFVSSQSTMHRITKLDIRKQCNKYVWDSTIEKLEEKVELYNSITDKGCEIAKELYLEILYNVPVGFELTARLTTNYRCLKTVYNQRKNHRLPEWREFCEQIKQELPYFKELCLKDDN